jgi:hypothetical protein
MSTPLEDSFYTEFSRLSPAQQSETLEFVRALNNTPRGTPGAALMEFVGAIPHEQVDPHGW